MKKLALSIAVISALSLSACDNETIEDIQKEVADNGTAVTAQSRVVFDPAKGVLSVPNDLLFLGTTDGTLFMPGEKDSEGLHLITPDYSDPSTALGVLDGWSTFNPFSLEMDFPDGKSLDVASASLPSSVRIFEAVMGASRTDDDCKAEIVSQGHVCKIVGELTFGPTGDYVTQASGNSVAIIPVKPLKPKTTYIVALTSSLIDVNGDSVQPSITYDLVRQDIATLPLATPSQLALQSVINSFEAAIEGEGVAHEDIIYTMAMTTQSTTDVLHVTKSLLATGLSPDPESVVVPLPIVSVTSSGKTVAQVLVAEGILDDSNPAHAALLGLHQAATVSTGTITLPYYLSAPTETNPAAPLNTWWRARCDSGATLAGMDPAMIPAGPLDANDAFCMAFNLRDLSSEVTIDSQRHLTQYNPIPAATGSNILDVQMTVPDLATVNYIRSTLTPALDPIVKPEGGWPVVILAHGIPSQKEHMLLTTGSLALQGLATIAIDHPLHNSRAFGPMNAAIDPLAYMNLGSLPTLRDNTRQSVADLLGLRFGINFLTDNDADETNDIDKTRVHYLGQSLGSITGANFLAVTNTPMAGVPDQVNGMFAVQASTLSVPTQGLAHALLGSMSFGDLLKANITMAGSEAFTAVVMMAAEQAGVTPNGEGWNALVVATYQAFWSQLPVEEQMALNSIYAKFAFAAQSVLDAGDPVNFAGQLAANQTPLHLIEVVGGLELSDGTINGGDRVLPNRVSSTPLGGTEPLISLLGLAPISETTMNGESAVSGAVRFLGGDHSSMFSPTPTVTSPDAMVSARAYQEMQTQAATYISTNGLVLPVVDTGLVAGNE